MRSGRPAGRPSYDRWLEPRSARHRHRRPPSTAAHDSPWPPPRPPPPRPRRPAGSASPLDAQRRRCTTSTRSARGATSARAELDRLDEAALASPDPDAFTADITAVDGAVAGRRRPLRRARSGLGLGPGRRPRARAALASWSGAGWTPASTRAWPARRPATACPAAAARSRCPCRGVPALRRARRPAAAAAVVGPGRRRRDRAGPALRARLERIRDLVPAEPAGEPRDRADRLLPGSTAGSPTSPRGSSAAPTSAACSDRWRPRPRWPSATSSSAPRTAATDAQGRGPGPRRCATGCEARGAGACATWPPAAWRRCSPRPGSPFPRWPRSGAVPARAGRRSTPTWPGSGPSAAR